MSAAIEQVHDTELELTVQKKNPLFSEIDGLINQLSLAQEENNNPYVIYLMALKDAMLKMPQKTFSHTTDLSSLLESAHQTALETLSEDKRLNDFDITRVRDALEYFAKYQPPRM